MKLVLNNITKQFAGKTVLDGFSISLKEAELCCLLGPSGCGKSTTLKIIAGFLKQDKGEIHLNGQEITGLTPQKRNVGLVFQNYALFPHLNVFDNVAYGLKRRKWKKDRIQHQVFDMLGLVQMEGYENRYIHELSGGQQQRIALARSLVTNPDLLLLDEPLSNLDAKLRIHMRNEIVRIQQKLKLTTVYVTHDQEEAMSIADRVVVMNKGFIEQIGRPREIYQNPSSLFVAGFIGKINLLRLNSKSDLNSDLEQLIGLSEKTGKVDGMACAIRPEAISLSNPDGIGVKAIIKQTVYLGSLVHYSLDLPGLEYPLLVEVPAPAAVFESGQTVGVKIAPEGIRLFDFQD